MLVLLGGGHTNTQVIRALRKKELPPEVSATLVSDSRLAAYSGMWPGCLAGIYEEREATLDLQGLCAACGWKFVQAKVTGVDCEQKRLILKDTAQTIDYEVLAIDVGSATRGADQFENAAEMGIYLVRTRPILQMLPMLKRFESEELQKSSVEVVVLGAGVAGVELSMAIHHRFLAQGVATNITVLDRNEQPLSCENTALRHLVLHQLKLKNISLISRAVVVRLDRKTVVISHESEQGEFGIPCDLLLLATGAAPHSFPDGFGPATTAEGWMLVDSYLSSVSHSSDIFGAGDCISMNSYPLGVPPRAGVHAVREGPPLVQNLLARLQHPNDTTKRVAYSPQGDFLKLISCGDETAVGGKWSIAFQGAWVWKLKDWLDRQWMSLFSPEALATAPIGSAPKFNPCLSPELFPPSELTTGEAAAFLSRGECPDSTKKNGALTFEWQWIALQKMGQDEEYRMQVEAILSKRAQESS